jgi:hypothetical protein
MIFQGRARCSGNSRLIQLLQMTLMTICEHALPWGDLGPHHDPHLQLLT